MTNQEAKEIVDIQKITFDIEDSSFGDGSVVVIIANVFDTEDEAKQFIEALKILCS